MVSGYDPQRGERFIAWVRHSSMNLYRWKTASYQDVVAFKVVDKQFYASS